MAISNKAELDAAILELEKKLVVQKQEMNVQFRQVKESLHPVNMAKGALNKLASAPEFTDGLMGTVTGLVAGVLSKKIFAGRSPGIIRRLVGELLQYVVTNTAIFNADKIKAYGKAVYHVFTGSNKKVEP